MAKTREMGIADGNWHAFGNARTATPSLATNSRVNGIGPLNRGIGPLRPEFRGIGWGGRGWGGGWGWGCWGCGWGFGFGWGYWNPYWALYPYPYWGNPWWSGPYGYPPPSYLYPYPDSDD